MWGIWFAECLASVTGFPWGHLVHQMKYLVLIWRREIQNCRLKNGIRFLALNPSCLSPFLLLSVRHSSHRRSVILSRLLCCCLLLIVQTVFASQTIQVTSVTKLNSKKLFSTQIQSEGCCFYWPKKGLAYRKLVTLFQISWFHKRFFTEDSSQKWHFFSLIWFSHTTLLSDTAKHICHA